MLHQCTSQPPEDGKPGYEFCAGQHFNPNLTWWEQSPAFFTYLSRCSYLLQQGTFAADVCFYLGEQPPTLVPPKYLVPGLGAGYDCDYCNAEVLLTRMSVKDGRVALPDGTAYRLLVLQNCVSPVDRIAREVGGYQGLKVSSTPSRAMSVEVVRKLRALVNDGATVIGAPPLVAAGLKGFPRCDVEVRQLAAELWGDLDGQTRTERRYGKGRIIWGKTPREVLSADVVAPDFAVAGQGLEPGTVDYLHRSGAGEEIYFVANRKNAAVTADCAFRVAGRQPEIFDPVTGDVRPALAFAQAEGRTTVPLEFAPFGSCFVVFRKPIDAAANAPVLTKVQALAGPWSLHFDPAWGGPDAVEFPDLISWTARPEPGIRQYSGKATYRKFFDLPSTVAPGQRLLLDLGDVRNVAEVRLNGTSLGVIWCAPWRVDVTAAVRPKENELQVDVINLWANRVIGDLNLPSEQRVTRTHEAFRFDMLTSRTRPLDAGLLGPVTILLANN